MFIRRARSRTTERGEYFSYRLVRSERSGNRVRQRTLLNLGSDFPVERGDWPLLCARIGQLLDRQGELVPLDCPQEVERHAQHIAAQLLNRAPLGAAERPDLQSVDVSTLALIRPRSVGVETAALWAMQRLGLEGLLERLGLNATQRALAMATIVTRFEDELRKLDDGLRRPRTRKRLDHVWQRIGRIREKSRGAGAHYLADVRADDSGEKARAVIWQRRPRAGTMISHPGVYCLRTNVDDWDEETLWRSYTTLTDVEAVFRSLKSELGLRPIFHRTQKRSDGHLFITVIAYQLVQTIVTIRRRPPVPVA